MIGCLLETQEDYLPKQAKLLKECLNAVSEYGIANLPLKYKLKMLLCMKNVELASIELLSCNSKYVGNWGDEAIVEI